MAETDRLIPGYARERIGSSILPPFLEARLADGQAGFVVSGATPTEGGGPKLAAANSGTGSFEPVQHSIKIRHPRRHFIGCSVNAGALLHAQTLGRCSLNRSSFGCLPTGQGRGPKGHHLISGDIDLAGLAPGRDFRDSKLDEPQKMGPSRQPRYLEDLRRRSLAEGMTRKQEVRDSVDSRTLPILLK